MIESTTTYFDMKIDTALYPYLTDKITGRVHYYDAKKQRIYTGNRVEKKNYYPTDKRYAFIHKPGRG